MHKYKCNVLKIWYCRSRQSLTPSCPSATLNSLTVWTLWPCSYKVNLCCWPCETLSATVSKASWDEVQVFSMKTQPNTEGFVWKRFARGVSLGLISGVCSLCGVLCLCGLALGWGEKQEMYEPWRHVFILERPDPHQPEGKHTPPNLSLSLSLCLQNLALLFFWTWWHLCSLDL